MASVMGFHLQYRLWIAELNSDINILRIFEDYLADTSANHNTENVLAKTEDYKNQFSALRKNIDELKHEMHINKMELAVAAKKTGTSIEAIEKNINHKQLAERYKQFRERFDRTKKNFQEFEENQ
jgi:hypothetical protein